MDITNKYRIYLGGVRGYLQYTECAQNEKPQYSKPAKISEITSLEWGQGDDILIGYKSGDVDIYDTISSEYRQTLEKLEGEGPVTGIGLMDESIIIARQDGIINITKGKENESFSMNLQENSTLDSMVYHQNRPGIIGTGGESNDFKLMDLKTQQFIFKAKSLGHDKLDLPIPTSIRGITFIPESEHLAACATKEGHVLLYDDRAQRRPVVKFLEEKASYTCITTACRDRQCFVGTTKGYLQLIDLKTPGKCLKTFTGYTGGVTSIVCDPTEPLVATTSLDRFLRIHNIETKELVYKAYLKQNLTKLLMKPLVKEEKEEGEDTNERENVDEEYEDIFNNMEVIEENDSIKDKKRKSKSEKSPIKKKKKKCINPLSLLKQT